ncbi:MAG: hypothetical protein ABI056_00365 [Caulobacteraceae bacterium]
MIAKVQPTVTVLLALMAAGCASMPARPSRGVAAAANYAPIIGSPAPLRGRLYADCIAQAATAGGYDQTSNSTTRMLRFQCEGAPARALYDELGLWSARRHSQWEAQGRTWRSTNRVIHNLFGVDYCSTDGGTDYRCAITLNVGDFLVG